MSAGCALIAACDPSPGEDSGDPALVLPSGCVVERRERVQCVTKFVAPDGRVNYMEFDSGCNVYTNARARSECPLSCTSLRRLCVSGR